MHGWCNGSINFGRIARRRFPYSLISAVIGAGKLAGTVVGGVGLAPAAEGVSG